MAHIALICPLCDIADMPTPPMDAHAVIVTLIRRYEAAGLSRRAIARRWDVPRAALYDYLEGSTPTPDRLQHIAVREGLTVETLHLAQVDGRHLRPRDATLANLRSAVRAHTGGDGRITLSNGTVWGYLGTSGERG